MNSKYRQAALNLHAMNAADRDWITTQIDEKQRNVLIGYLKELKELGIPSEISKRESPEYLEIFQTPGEEVIDELNVLQQKLLGIDKLAIWQLVKSESSAFIEVLLCCLPTAHRTFIEQEYFKLHSRKANATETVSKKLMYSVLYELHKCIDEIGVNQSGFIVKPAKRETSVISKLLSRLLWSK